MEEAGEHISDSFIIPGYKDINAVVQYAFKSVMTATKTSNELPSSGDDYDYYSSFNSFRDVMDVEGQRILHMMQNIMRYHGAKGNLSTSSTAVEIEDKFDVLIDANDQILERVGNFLDEASGIKKNDNSLVIASMSASKQHISGSWNKKKSSGSAQGTSYRLLAAKHVQRPQIRFRDKVDNSLRAFVPQIKEKPNAMRPIPESIYQAQQEKEKVSTREDEEYDLTYPHPYQYELDHFVPLKRQLEIRDPQMPKSIEDTPLLMVNSKEELVKLYEILKKEREFSVDLEHHSYRTFQGITCLLQISTRTCDYIIDTLELRSELHLLNEVFTDPNIVKVFHGADKDVEWLQRDFGIYVVNMFDTGQASRVLNMSRFSLAHLLRYYCDVEADKQYQLADWRIRPLPEELIKYAREDTHYLLYIHDKMTNELLEQGNQQSNLVLSTIQRSTQVCARKYEKPRPPEDAHMEMFMKSKKVFNSRQMAALKGLYNWRDKTARTEDESTGYVLPNHMLLQIAEILPKEMQGVLACCNPIPPLVRQSLHALHRIVKEAREVPLTKPDVYKSSTLKPTMLQHPKYDSESILHCPHDKSHQHKVDRKFPAVDVRSSPDPKYVSNKSSIFGTGLEGTITVKDRPTISLMGDELATRSPDATEGSSALRKSIQIKSSFFSPLRQYLPSGSGREFMINSELAVNSAPELRWKLLPPTCKSNKSSDTAAEEVKETPLTQVVTELNDDGAIPLRQQMTASKKNVNLKRKSEESSPSSGPIAKKVVEQPSPRTNAVIKSWPPKSGKALDCWPPRPNPKDCSDRKKKLSVQEVEASNFQAHDYSEESLHMFTAKSKRTTKEYHPSTQEVESKNRGPGRAKLNPKSGQMSMSFGKSNTRGKSQWPRKY